MTTNCSRRILHLALWSQWAAGLIDGWLSCIHSKVTLPELSLFETFSFSWHGYRSAPITGGQWSLSENSHRTPARLPAWRTYLHSKYCSRWIRYRDCLEQVFSSHGQQVTYGSPMSFEQQMEILSNCRGDPLSIQVTWNLCCCCDWWVCPLSAYVDTLRRLFRRWYYIVRCVMYMTLILSGTWILYSTRPVYTWQCNTTD
jgi:hypothetical protein